MAHVHAPATKELAMLRVGRSIVFAVLVCVCSVVSAAAQPPAPASVRDALQRQWIDINQKIVKMAEDFPDAKYDFRATDGVRTFADVLRHVAFWNSWVAKTARGEKVDGKPNELPKEKYPTKAAVVTALKSSVDEATASLKAAQATPDPKLVDLWVSFIAHGGEHYGQLVVYYRLNGLVPPASRPSN
jgi:uncharacterized damage-inducible protein DinB